MRPEDIRQRGASAAISWSDVSGISNLDHIMVVTNPTLENMTDIVLLGWRHCTQYPGPTIKKSKGTDNPNNNVGILASQM
jgi:hypothetical protein